MSNPTLLEFNKISKAYGPVQANREISFKISQGEIHALIGENGAGKSTLMKILFGLETPDTGEILLHGKVVRFRSPQSAKRHGLGMVQQHFQLASNLSALDHVLLEENRTSVFASLFEKLDRKAWRQKLISLSERFNLPIPWDQPVGELSVGLQQRLEVLKLLAFDTEILILDEPTAVLTPQETEQFLSRLKQLRDAGKTIILITHKLREVMAVADRVTVLRQGQVVASESIAGHTARDLARWMVGHEFSQQEFERKVQEPRTLVRVEKLSAWRGTQALLQDLNFHIRSGEILGVAGVHGNGQSELIKALLLPRESGLRLEGAIWLEETNLLHLSGRQIRERGAALVPEDRLHQAVIPSFTARENYMLGRPDFFKGRKILSHNRDEEIGIVMRDFSVRPENADLLFSSFSGGNQQKLVVARELGSPAKLLVIAEPTRGVDIGAIELIHAALMKARDEGAAILLISSELDELLRLSDRLMVMNKGQNKGILPREEFDVTQIGCLMGGET